MAHEVKRAQPLTPEILLDVLGILDLNKYSDLSFWAILLIGFFGMLRKSNLMPESQDSFGSVHHLTRDHIYFKDDIAVIRVTWSKTIQNREKLVEIPIFPIEDSPLCPVRALKALLAQNSKGHHSLFGKAGKVTWNYNAFQKKLCKTLRKAGYKERAFSSHSMRWGGASFTYRSGVPENLIQVHWDWASDAFKNYLDFPIALRALVSLKMRNRILKSKLY